MPKADVPFQRARNDAEPLIRTGMQAEKSGQNAAAPERSPKHRARGMCLIRSGDMTTVRFRTFSTDPSGESVGGKILNRRSAPGGFHGTHLVGV